MEVGPLKTNRPTPPSWGKWSQWRSAAVNRDGRGEILVHIRDLNPGVSVTVLDYSIDNEWHLHPPTNNIWPTLQTCPPKHLEKCRYKRGWSATTLLGLICNSPVCGLQRWSRPLYLDLLAKYTNSFGGITTIGYTSSAKFVLNYSSPNCYLPVGVTMQLVSAIVVVDGHSPVKSKQDYQYACPRWWYYRRKRTLLSWHEIEAHSQSAQHRPDSTTVTLYHTSDKCLAQPTYAQVSWRRWCRYPL